MVRNNTFNHIEYILLFILSAPGEEETREQRGTNLSKLLLSVLKIFLGKLRSPASLAKENEENPKVSF